MNISYETKTLLSLLCLPRVGVATVRKIANSEAGNNWCFDTLVDNYLVHIISDSQREEALRDAEKILNICSKNNLSIVSMVDDTYPALLKKIKDAPPILYIKGSTQPLNSICAAVVGTRKASEIGLKISDKVAQSLTENGFTVVSGLALGIDTAAHKGAIKNAGKTIAILAHGLDTISPTSNNKLAEEIIEKGGALISEHPPGTPARPPEFVRRNRIQSGMSRFSVIVETGEVGGTIYHAKFAREQGKDIYSIIPPQLEVYDKFDSSGGRMIIATMGGVKIGSSEELLRCLFAKANSALTTDAVKGTSNCSSEQLSLDI